MKRPVSIERLLDPGRAPTLLAALLGAFLLAACGGEQSEEESGPPEATRADPCSVAAMLDPDTISARESGLRVQQIEEGRGPPAEAGDTVVVHYTGCLTDGTRFDSSRDRDEPFPVVLGQGRVIQGWEEGLVGLRTGGERRLIIPPDLAYGDRGAGDVIPPNSTLVFHVELLEIVGAPADTTAADTTNEEVSGAS